MLHYFYRAEILNWKFIATHHNRECGSDLNCTALRLAENGVKSIGGFAPVSNDAIQSPSNGPNLKARPLPPAKTATF